ncbi:protochlorophyllide oxidoreductase [Pseudohalioglobus sediminis]|uniref:Protochlorophyllide oxidoreductase n=1 Tax=Pseudohalioglobus sediminis TaxID=2606449 RepID=A0A5B0WSI4_9GAMM|nr:protochlorophyllide oxidoreductase [Pseudohalioglobus sediminis]
MTVAKPPITWDADAAEQLKRAPFFIRKLARKRVEVAARQQGLDRVTLQLVQQVKQKEMPQ